MSDHEKKRPLLRLLDAALEDDPAVRQGRRLAEMAGLLDVSHVFTKGQLVRWKPGMKHLIYPKADDVAIVTEILAEPIIDDHHTGGSPYYLEPLSLVIGVFEEGGDFLEFRVDGRRFEPFEA